MQRGRFCSSTSSSASISDAASCGLSSTIGLPPLLRLRALSCAAFRGRGAGAPGSGFASGRLLHKVAGTQLAPNSSRPRPSMLSLAVQRWPMRKSQHARPPIIAASPIVFQLGTSPFSRPPKPSGGVAAVHGRRRVGRQLRRRPEIPLDPPRGLVNEARPARLLPDRGGHRVQERRPLRGLDRPGKLEQQRSFLRRKNAAAWSSSSGWGRATMRPCAPRLQEATKEFRRVTLVERRRIGTRPPPRRSAYLPGVPARFPALALACHLRKPGEVAGA